MKNVFILKYLLFSVMIFVFVITANICVLAEEEWKIVKTKNFQIVGNASEKELKAIYTSINGLEEVFSRMFEPTRKTANIPTNIIVFKNDKDFKPFKPLENGGVKDWVAGYFQPGEDVNYIAISAKADTESTNQTIFHEYTHSLVNNYFGQENVPPWINEGLAEYFEPLSVKKKDKVILGSPEFAHGLLDETFQIMPLEDFFNIDYKNLRKMNENEIKKFYAQSWLLIHFILNGNNENLTVNLKRFLYELINGKRPEIAYREIFDGSLADLEKDLQKYLLRNDFSTRTRMFENDFNFEPDSIITMLSVAEVNAFKGDLLFNTNRFAEAEIYLNRALSLDPKSSIANASMGLLKMKEGDFQKAKHFLATALREDWENHLVHYKYAYILSREDADKSGYISGFDLMTYEKMRKSLEKSISLKPNYAEALYLFAFINLVQDSDYEKSIAMLKKALEISPHNQWYLMRLSEFYYRQRDFENAEKITSQIAEKTSDKHLLEYARRNLEMIDKLRTSIEKENQIPTSYVRNSDGMLTKEEQEILREKLIVEALSRMLRKPKDGEERMLGILSKIDCRKNGISYLLETNEKSVEFKSKTFENLSLSIFNYSWDGENFGCGSSFRENLVIITFRPHENQLSNAIGEIVGIEFVPNYFTFPDNGK